jgi:phosphoribosylanthranilate isomerase
MKWKVCGMRERANIAAVAACKPDFMGFIFVEKSPRYVGKDFVIPEDLLGATQAVGVFVNETVERIIAMAEHARFKWVQLHGEEGDSAIEALKRAGLGVIKAVSVAAEGDLLALQGAPDYYLLDTKKGSQVGGTGERFDWSILKAYRSKVPFFLAGGISEENMVEAMELRTKYPLAGLDFNSRLEIQPGFKDLEKIKDIAKKIAL